MRSLTWRAIALLVIVILLAPGQARAQFGRTQGGIGGAALGAMGSSAAGAALVAAAGFANPLLGGAIVSVSTLAGTLAGAKLGSKAGNTLDANVSKTKAWMAVGAVTGGLAGFIFGPGGGMVGKVLGASVGAALGAWAGNHFAGQANQDYNPRTYGALVGGVNGALIGGPVGAAVGVPLGYIAGNILDKDVFSNGTYNLPSWRYGKSYDDSATTAGGSDKLFDFQNRHGYYPNGSKGSSIGGFDRQGFDNTGYDKHGFDREGYDRFGYDKNGRDRLGFDSTGYAKNAPGVQAKYDPTVYNDFWQAWGQTGGPYPKFDKSHWDAFPDASKSAAYDRYTAASSTASSSTASTAAAPSSTLVSLKQDYMKAVETMQKTAATGSDADKAAALDALKAAEAALAAKCKEEGVAR